MLQPRELEQLMEILSSRESSIEEVEGTFLSVFADSLPVFNASLAMSNLLNHNLLTPQQRIVALFLLIENFKSEGIRRHPFGATILTASLKTPEPFERRMIAELVIDGKREKYARAKVEQLHEEEQGMTEATEERPEIKKLRDEFIAALPPIGQVRKSEVSGLVSDHGEKGKKQVAPEHEVGRASLREAETGGHSFNVGFMLPIPAFVDIAASEFNWLSPGVVTDLHWDNTAEIERKLAKSKGLIKKGLEHHLSKEEATEIDRSLETEPYAVLNLDLTPESLGLLVRHNPFVAISFLVKMANYPLVADYLEGLLDSPLTLNSIDVTSRLTKACRLPPEFLQTYALKNLAEAQKIPENHKDRGKLPRVLSTFLKTLVKNNLLELGKFEAEVEDFVKAFIEVEEVQSLKRVLHKE